MGIFEKLGLRKDWAKEEAKLSAKEEQQKNAPAEFKAEPLSEDEERFNYLIEGITGKREEREELGKKEAEIREQKMLKEFMEGIGYRYTAKAEERLNQSGEVLDKGNQGFWKKLSETAKMGLTAAYTVPKEMGKFAGGQVVDLAKGLREGTAAALSRIPEAGLDIAEFAKERVAKPAKEIYGQYSEEVSKSLGIGAGVATTKYEAASEWVKVNSAKSWFQGKEALGKFRAGIIRTNKSFNEKLKQWPVERQLKRSKEKAYKTQEAALLAEQKAAEASEMAAQAAKEYDALRSAFENVT